MEPQSLQWIAEACGADVAPGGATAPVRRIVTDSRLVGPGDLFVALQGERFDGHAFLGDIAARGAVAALVDGRRPRPALGDTVALEVTDPRAAYGRIAAAYRRRFQLPVVCVAGSNGKTTTKEWIAAVLGARFPTLRSEASFNNDVGVPATLLRLDATHGAAVLEAGTNHPGELAPLVRAIAPQVGVLTSFGREHLEFFGDIDGVVAEEGALAEGLPAGGTLVLDGDSPFAGAVAGRVAPGVDVVRVGRGPGNAWRILSDSQDWDGTTFRVESVVDPRWSGVWRVPLPGGHSVQNATYALAVGAVLGVDPAAARSALATAPSPRQRLARLRLGGVRILDDTYNANADSMLAALQTLADLPCAGRRVAVLGDMGELGARTEAAHREVGAASARHLQALFCVGDWAGPTADAARAAGLAHVESFRSVADALPALLAYLRPDDTLLVKASRAARLEQVLAALGEAAATRGHPLA